MTGLWNLDARVEMPGRVLFRELDGEAILLEQEGGRYYGLDEVGTRIWLLLRDGCRLREVLERLHGEYDVDEDRLQRDLIAFVREMSSKGLLRIHDEPDDHLATPIP